MQSKFDLGAFKTIELKKVARDQFDHSFRSLCQYTPLKANLVCIYFFKRNLLKKKFCNWLISVKQFYCKWEMLAGPMVTKVPNLNFRCLQTKFTSWTLFWKIAVDSSYVHSMNSQRELQKRLVGYIADGKGYLVYFMARSIFECYNQMRGSFKTLLIRRIGSCDIGIFVLLLQYSMHIASNWRKCSSRIHGYE